MKSIERACPKAKVLVLKAFAMKGTRAQKLDASARKEVMDWINKIRL